MLPRMYRHTLPLRNLGRSPLNGDKCCVRVLLVGVLLAATGMLGAQETSPLLKAPSVQNLAVLFARPSSIRTPLPIPYESPLTLERLQIVRHSQTSLFEVHPASSQLL